MGREGGGFASYAYPRDIQTNVAGWPRCAQLLPHALAVTERAESLQAGMEQAAEVLNSVGLHLLVMAQFVGAKAHFQRALGIAEAAFGPDHPNVSIRVNNLGSVLPLVGDCRGPGSTTSAP
ncbi:MAG: tetratricopeptide repeat protein [Chloroflexi bacterium]|nr:tetratricopeptide repeat protein [Chloroflexota bacterium]